MQALRETVKVKGRNCSIQLPDWAVGQELEVIILPSARQVGVESKSNGESLGRFAGAWRGDSMVRENEGTYEVRDELK
jgi:hypothetical protein